MAAAGALAAYSDQDLISRISAGEIPSRIADKLGVHKSALYHRFADNPLYLKAKEEGLENRLSAAELAIEESADQFTLSRARELFRAVSWRAEREHPARWGAKQQLDVRAINVQIVEYRPDAVQQIMENDVTPK